MDSTNPDLWRRVFAAADIALELEPEKRIAFVKQCSIEDRVLGDELSFLLASGGSASLLDGTAAALVGPILSELDPLPVEALPQSSFGPYRIIRELGHGGMGAVYLAERSDDQYRKQVALKILPAWSAGDDRKVQRFLEERQILAALDHPEIAGLLDGGITPDGVPWFAMEFVEGVSIDRYCDERSLPIRDRLQLFVHVCAAVQYAHRNLVVHRDIKPANILITGEGRVRLLDFGIAKLLGGNPAELEVTIASERMLTPLYASPEQIRGEPISTATDVYSLGVLLNVLLTGRYPYCLSRWEHRDVSLAVLEQEPTQPSLAILRPGCSPRPNVTPEQVATTRGATTSRLRRQLQGDLDAIVLKAVEKEPSRRYATAEQLETEVSRYLTGQPVLARPKSRLYYARKFVRRNRTGVGITGAVTVLVLASGVVATIQASRIRTQAESIALERDRVKAVNKYLTNIFAGAAPGRPDRGVTGRDILDSASARLDGQRLADGDRAHLMLEMARTYHRLNLHDQARRLAERTVALHRSARPGSDADLAESLNLLGSVLLSQNQLGSAEIAYREALTLKRVALGPRHSSVARTLVGLSAVLRKRRRLTEAEAFSREALAIDNLQPGATPADVAQSTTGLARVLLDKGDHRGAASLFRRSLILVRQTRPEEHADVAAAVLDLAAALKIADEHSAADSLVRYGVGLYQRLLSTAALGGASDVGTADAARLHSGVTAAVQQALADQPPPQPNAPATGPSGRSQIAFTSDRDGPDPVGDLGNQEIYVMNVDGSGQRRLTYNDAVDQAPSWSPDGKRIAFTSRREGGFEIFVMNADGTGQKRLTRLTQRGFGATQAAWSPDGTRIAFRSRSRHDIYVINADGTGLANLTRHPAADDGPSWSPDGRKIAFVSDRDGNFEIYVMDSDGGNVVRLTRNEARDQQPAWSPDGRRIAFHSNRDGDQEIYVLNSDGSQPVRLTSNPGEDGSASWSPDGREIVFHRRTLGHLQIYRMNADGSNPRRLTELSSMVFNAFPDWGPRQR